MTKYFGRDETLFQVHKETYENLNVQINGLHPPAPSHGSKDGPKKMNLGPYRAILVSNLMNDPI